MVLLKIVYDIDVEDENDAYVKIFDAAIAGAVEGMVPGKFLVEVLPFLRHVPLHIGQVPRSFLFRLVVSAKNLIRSQTDCERR